MKPFMGDHDRLVSKYYWRDKRVILEDTHLRALSTVRPYQINIMFHGSANSVFVTNKKKIKIVFVSEHIQPGGEAMWLRLCSLVSRVNYHVTTVEDGSFFRLSQQRFPHGASVCLHCTCSSPEVPGFFPKPPLGRDCPALCLAACLMIPCQFSKSSSFINVSASISSNNGSYMYMYTVSSSPTSYTSLSLLLLSLVLLTVEFFLTDHLPIRCRQGF